MRRQQLAIDDTGSVEGVYDFMYCTKWRSGQVLLMPYGLTHSLTDPAPSLIANIMKISVFGDPSLSCKTMHSCAFKAKYLWLHIFRCHVGVTKNIGNKSLSVHHLIIFQD